MITNEMIKHYEELLTKKDEEIAKLKSMLKDTKYNATHDFLTGCKNRTGFDEDIRMMNKDSLVVISLDVNYLKKTNDTFGHHMGDTLLLTVVAEIQSYFSNVYRMGGDEFCVLADIDSFNPKFLEYMDQNLNSYKDDEFKYSVAWGYAYGKNYETIKECYNAADALMYDNKKEKCEDNDFLHDVADIEQ